MNEAGIIKGGDIRVTGSRAENIANRTTTIWDSMGHDVGAELSFQDRKWGIRDNDSGQWMLILTEEIGEMSEAILQGRQVDAYDEIVQSIAVLVRMAEKVLR